MKRLVRNLKFLIQAPFKNLSRFISILFKTNIQTGPILAAVSLTSTCHTHCLMCWYHSPLMKQDDDYNNFNLELSYNVVKQLLIDLKDIGVKRLFISGEGEPFNHPDIKKILKLIKQLKFEFFMITNITNLSPEKADLLFDSGLIGAEISTHASSFETYKKIYPVLNEKFFELGKTGLKRLIELRNKFGYPRIELIHAICKQNIDDLENIIKDAVNFNIDKLTLKRGLFNSQLRSQLEPDPEQFTKAFDVLTRYKDIKIKNNFVEFALSIKSDSFDSFKEQVEIDTIQGGGEVDNYRFCYIPYLTTNILADGLVLSCNYDPFAVRAGNINYKSFKEIWFSHKYQAYRKQRKCRACLALSTYPYMNGIRKITKITNNF
ncbi:radical SAM protein [Candidatus Dependentiae bacterium]|nr:radical SAM protein [Candidatus Dependentiae bacterium]